MFFAQHKTATEPSGEQCKVANIPVSWFYDWPEIYNKNKDVV
jgi:hypothetical protein